MKAQALHRRAIAERERGQLETALATLRKAQQLAPSDPAILNTQGVVYLELDKLAAAERSFRSALSCSGLYAEAHYNLGRVQERLQQGDAAETSYRTALTLRPDWAQALEALGLLLCARQDYTQGRPLLAAALALNPGSRDLLNNLAQISSKLGDWQAEMAYYGEALKLGVDTETLLRFAMVLPLVYTDEADIAQHRQRLLTNLEQLSQAQLAPLVAPHRLGALTFPVIYQGLDPRPVHAAYGALFARLIAPVKLKPIAERPPGTRRRVAVVSNFLREHTIGRLYAQIVANLDRERLEIAIFMVDASADALTRGMLHDGESLTILPSDFAGACQVIWDWQPDIIFYPELGMDGYSYALAAHRLAPIQCVCWGHPVTSGLPSMDYFLSSQELEPAHSDDDYTERLIRLDVLPTSYAWDSISAEPLARTALGFSAEARLYSCLQSPFKIHPRFDCVLLGILETDPHAHILLLGDETTPIVQHLKARFEQCLNGHHKRVRFLGAMPRSSFLNTVASMDVCLDPHPYGGGNTTLEALAIGCPVITTDSPIMAGRVAMAMYRQLGVTECIARDLDHYVQLAVEYARSPELRLAFKARVSANKHRLFDNPAPARALSEFFATVPLTTP